MNVVAQINRKSPKAHAQTEHHNVLGKGIRNSQESCTVPVYVLPVETPLAHVPDSYYTLQSVTKLVSALSADKNHIANSIRTAERGVQLFNTDLSISR